MRDEPAHDNMTSQVLPTLESGAFLRSLVIGLTAFFTLVDLFAAQAILPSLTSHYGVSPGAMGLAVNSSTLGMAIAGLAVAFFSQQIDRRLGILLSLALLSIPTSLLAVAPSLTVFAGLRVAQGLFMATAFSLTLAYLGERYSARDAASAFAAYITGNVASNLIGRFVAAAVVDHAGLATNFHVFAGLNLLGAALVYFTVARVPRMKPESAAEEAQNGSKRHQNIDCGCSCARGKGPTGVAQRGTCHYSKGHRADGADGKRM